MNVQSPLRFGVIDVKLNALQQATGQDDAGRERFDAFMAAYKTVQPAFNALDNDARVSINISGEPGEPGPVCGGVSSLGPHGTR